MKGTAIRIACCVLALWGCGDDAPLVCPAGTIPRSGECVPDVDGSTFDAGLDAGTIALDASVDAPPDAGCVPSAEPDVPDEDFLDSDCDGVDGNADSSVFVSATGRADGAGTRTDPVATITQGISLAASTSRTHVLVANGDYSDAVVLEEGVAIVGGYDATTWQRSDSRARVRAASPVLRGSDIAEPTLVLSLDFEATDATEPGTSSIAALLVQSSGVRLERVALTAGRGADGADGVTPSRPPQAAMGTMGGNGVRSGTCVSGEVEPTPGGGGAPSSGCGCGNGGRGGLAGDFWRNTTLIPATAGTHGCEPAWCDPLRLCNATMPGGPGSGGIGGRTGSDGPGGAPGSDGAGAEPLGNFSADGYLPADGASGGVGGPGAGGGGGGGGTGCAIDHDGYCRGAGGAGGGGGAGGCGGAGGLGGGGGGASIALYLWESTPTLVRVAIRAADGGAGGNGALGGEGGLGGIGGPGGQPYRPGGANPACLTGTPTAGGVGGLGGAGGRGGGGGGGTGGPSIGILLGAGSNQAGGSSGVTIMTGNGGIRGFGGGTAATGENGQINATFTVEG